MLWPCISELGQLRRAKPIRLLCLSQEDKSSNVNHVRTLA